MLMKTERNLKTMLWVEIVFSAEQRDGEGNAICHFSFTSTEERSER